MSMSADLPADLPAAVPAALLEAALTGLAAIFLTAAGGDMASARQAAADALGAHRPQTGDELRLATIIIGFSFRAIEALAQSASLSREAAKAERRLVELRKAGKPAVPAVTATPEPVLSEVKIEPPVVPSTATPNPPTGKVAEAVKANGVTWTQAYDDRQRELRIAASLKKAEARIAAQTAAQVQGPAQDHRPMAVAV